ncbi:MAG: hypothetical protein ACLPGW_04435, partial [Roseiarcus sp.]
MLVLLRSIARGDFVSDSDGGGVTVTPPVTPKKPGVTPVTPITPKNDKRGKETTEARAANFVSPQKEDADAIEECAGLAADRVPLVYLDARSRLNCRKPARVSDAEWHRALDDGGQFVDAWGNDAVALQWTPGELFDVKTGLVWRLAGERVE